MDNTLKISDLWEAKNINNAYVSFCIPQEIFDLQLYHTTELIKLLKYDDAEYKQDAENKDKKFVCFKKELPISNDSVVKFFESITNIANDTIYNIKLIFPKPLINNIDYFSQDKNKFWRYLFNIDNSLVEDLESNLINYYAEQDHQGPHIKLQVTENQSIIRIKARNLYDLAKMMNNLNKKIKQNY